LEKSTLKKPTLENPTLVKSTPQGHLQPSNYSTTQLWHNRLAHPSYDLLAKTAEITTGITDKSFNKNDLKCKKRITEKSTQRHLKYNAKKAVIFKRIRKNTDKFGNYTEKARITNNLHIRFTEDFRKEGEKLPCNNQHNTSHLKQAVFKASKSFNPVNSQPSYDKTTQIEVALPKIPAKNRNEYQKFDDLFDNPQII
jgi:hypothetical protein